MRDTSIARWRRIIVDRLRILGFVGVALVFAGSARADGPSLWMVRLKVDGRAVEGSPISWSDREIHLLGRDGRLWNFNPAQTTSFERTPAEFRSYSPSELRAMLLRELGHDYEVSGTSHYLLAHPDGEGDKWTQRFEDLYRSFVRYMSVRGFQARPPRFPLVGIVCKDQADFLRQSAAQGEMPQSGVVGCYNLESNRIMLYDMGGKTNSPHWKQNAGVLIHEATHQIAFNLGVHSRYAPPPRWLAEGLAMLFEAPGVCDARQHPYLNDRINYPRLRAFQQGLLPGHRPETLVALLASDDLFARNPAAAYAEAWALTFFLVEQEPTNYVAYLKLTAARPPFTDYPQAARVKDFAALFGDDWRMLEARFLRFIGELR
jgi:hypothetical protein